MALTGRPKNVTTGLEKRWDEELENMRMLNALEKILKDYLEEHTTSSVSSDSSGSSSPLVTERPPAPIPPNPASSTANWNPSMDPGRSSSTSDAIVPWKRPDPLIDTWSSPSPKASSNGILLLRPASGPEVSTTNLEPLLGNSAWEVDSQASVRYPFEPPWDDELPHEGDDEFRRPPSSESSPTSSDWSDGSGLSMAEEHMYTPEPDHYSIASTDSSTDSDFDRGKRELQLAKKKGRLILQAVVDPGE